MTSPEVDAILGKAGHTAPGGANWVILETDGTLSVIPRQDLRLQDAELLRSVDTGGMRD